MGITYVRPPCDAQGNRLSYEQRRALRRQQEEERRAQQEKQGPTRPDFYGLPYAERKRIREAEHQAAQEATTLAQQQEQERIAAEQAAIPDHERRPMNPWTRLIQEWESHAYRPEVARKLREYKRREKEEEKRIDAEMAEKKAQHLREIDPERLRALDHFDKMADGATEDPETLARLRAIIDSGNASMYWDEVSPILQQRLARAQEATAKATEAQNFNATEASAAKAEASKAQELLDETAGEAE